MQSAPEGQSLVEAQPSAAQRNSAGASKWEMLLGTDEPEPPAEAAPGPPKQSAPSAAQPKMALRFQMMIDSQELEAKRQRGASSKSQGPSLSAAVYPVGSPRQSSRHQQGHQSMPHLQSSTAPGKQPRSRKPKPWELLLAAQEPRAEGSASAAARVAFSERLGKEEPAELYSFPERGFSYVGTPPAGERTA